MSNISLNFSVSCAEGIAECPLSRARLRRLMLASLSHVARPALLKHGAMFNLRLCDEKEARALNRAHRQKTYAPNVLTFEYPTIKGQPLMADIALCMPVVALEAGQQGKNIDHHFAHLLVHGCLHALGFDHEEEVQAVEMEGIERAVLKRFRIADPYLVRSPSPIR
jgi:probable rRNA maturation factor